MLAADNRSSLSPDEVAGLKSILFGMSKRIFDNVTPREQEPHVDAADVNYTTDMAIDVVDGAAALEFLTADGGKHSRQLIQIVESGVRDVLKDDMVTLADVPAILKMVRAIAAGLNTATATGAKVHITVDTLLPMVEILVCLVAQMILPAGEFAVAKSIICCGFDLLKTTVKNPAAVGFFSKLRCLFGGGP